MRRCAAIAEMSMRNGSVAEHSCRLRATLAAAAVPLGALTPRAAVALAEAAMTLLEKYRALVAQRRDRGRSRAGGRRRQARRARRERCGAGAAARRACCVAQRRRAGAQGALHFRPRRPRQDHADGPVLRGHHVPAKRRVHFHEFMAEVHDRIGAARKSEPGDPIPHVARAIAAKTRAAVLRRAARHRHRRCHDPGPAVQGRCSRPRWWWWPPPTCRPRELYKNGLNRAAVPALHRAASRSTWTSRSCWRPRTSGSRSLPASRSTSRRPTRAPRPRWTGSGPS